MNIVIPEIVIPPCALCGAENVVGGNMIRVIAMAGDYGVFEIGVCDRCQQRRRIEDLLSELDERDDEAEAEARA